MAARLPPISVYLKEPYRTWLKKEADELKRSVTAHAEWIIESYFRRAAQSKRNGNHQPEAEAAQ